MVDISTLVSHQFPEFYQEDGENLVAFVKAYYEWFEQSNLINASSLTSLSDIDTTVDEFVTHFKQKYLAGVPDDSQANLRSFVKFASDLYDAKGTEAAIQLLFRLLFNVTAQLYTPLDDTFAVSADRWILPHYIEVTQSPLSPTYVRKRVFGSFSGATAIVNAMCRKRSSSGAYYDVLYLMDVEGTFKINESIVDDSGTTLNAPKIIGSLADVILSDGGANNKIGDVFTVSSSFGRGGKVRVTSTIDGSRRVNTTLTDGGAVYTANAYTFTSNVFLNTAGSANTAAFTFFETVEQPLFTVNFTGANGTFSVGDSVQGWMSGSWRNEANGVIVNINTTGANGTATVFTTAGNFRIGDTFRKAGNAITSNIASATDVTAIGSIIGKTTSAIGLAQTANQFYVTTGSSTWIRGRTSGAVANVISIATGSGAGWDIAAIAQDEACYLNTDLLTTNTTAGVPLAYVNIDGSGSGIGSVNAISIVAGGTGYANGASLTFVGGGKQLSSFTFTSPTGTGYANGDTLSFSGGINALAYVTTNGSGGITGVTLVDSGNYFSAIPTVTVNTASGSGAAITAVLANSTSPATATLTTNTTGGIVSVNITSNGAAYFSAPTITAPTGTGANLQPVMTYGLGFPKKPTANTNSPLTDSLTMALTPIGTIFALNGISVGSNYNTNPMTKALEPLVEGFDQKDLIVLQSNTVGGFAVGEIVTAPYLFAVQTLTYTGITGNTAFDVGEWVGQSSNTVGGTIFDRDSTTLKMINPVGSFVATSGAATQIHGLTSNATANVTIVASSNVTLTAKGLVVANDGTNVTIRPRTFTAQFTPNVVVTGASTGATTQVVTITPLTTSLASGNNAVISSVVQSANGIATNIDVVDSGFAYRDLETVTLTNIATGAKLVGQTVLGDEGVGSGYHLSQKSFPSQGNHLQDSWYYQIFSYEVQSEIPFNTYSNVLKQLLHVAGTKMFGKVMLNPNASMSVDVSSEMGILISAGGVPMLDFSIFSNSEYIPVI